MVGGGVEVAEGDVLGASAEVVGEGLEVTRRAVAGDVHNGAVAIAQARAPRAGVVVVVGNLQQVVLQHPVEPVEGVVSGHRPRWW